MDPRNITLEPEYYHEIDQEKYNRVKPLIWLWEMFDKSPLGENVHLSVLFRRVLAKRIFKKCGKNFKAFHFVKFSFGYNLEVGDGVVVHRHVLLDDRGGIRIGNGASIADFANVYSHTHDIVDPHLIDCPATIIEDGVRITYHATVLAGVQVAKNSMVGAPGRRDPRHRAGDTPSGDSGQGGQEEAGYGAEKGSSRRSGNRIGGPAARRAAHASGRADSLRPVREERPVPDAGQPE